MTTSTPYPDRAVPEDPIFREPASWPAKWIVHPRAEEPFVAAYRLHWHNAGEPETVRVYVTADERYELWLDGARIGRGPERSLPGA